ncbi:RNA-binding S4 domain-containing protein [Thermochromatium tepidum ATCC 43061]|uniref:Heat shock protein 15 n=2 Tax=Thermochromatium tepidum TaxID=1050 RepID=A0A6I6E7Y5_THETI|nr:S4 domain-containing protein [Thermochromatium tepidum]QGU34002.1 RNA-binding S4 domain-containing protein [Thermochromatium tepidum ATCC 43061]
MTERVDNPADAIRLDKWLWAARFFKTRQLAIEAINGGKVHVDGQRVKPSRLIRPGSRLEIHKDSLSWEIEVRAINTQRRPAAEAALLYAESEASRLRRQELVRERRELGVAAPDRKGRPTKRDRRRIQRFTEHGDSVG